MIIAVPMQFLLKNDNLSIISIHLRTVKLKGCNMERFYKLTSKILNINLRPMSNFSARVENLMICNNCTIANLQPTKFKRGLNGMQVLN